MFAPNIYQNIIRDELPEFVSQFEPRPLENSEYLDRYLAASLLQKAIRRDDSQSAWQAASYLLENFPAYFWKRLPIIGMEEIGLGDPTITMQSIIIGTEPNLRAEFGGCLKVATALVETMCAATKDRSADDLFDVISRDPNLREARIEVFENDLRHSTPKSNHHGDRALEVANRMAVLAGCVDAIPSGQLRKRIWTEAMWAADQQSVAGIVHETALLGLQRTGSVLAPMLFALGCFPVETRPEIDDELLPISRLSQVPTWALGQHTRVGLSGFRKFINRSPDMNALIREVADGSVSKSRVIGGLVFRMYCGQLRHRLDWSLGADLKRRATYLGWGIPDAVVPNALGILRSEFDLLNQCRVEALQEYLK